MHVAMHIYVYPYTCVCYLQQDCITVSDRELSCIFPAIPPNLLDDIAKWKTAIEIQFSYC